MTTQQTPQTTPQIPESLHAAMAEWGRHHAALGQIDAESARVDAQLSELQKAAAELGQRHRDLGMQRHAVEGEASLARSMVEHGCQLAGLPMPEQPPAMQPPAAEAPRLDPAPVAYEGPPPGEPTGFFQPAGVEMLAAVGQPAVDASETVTDPPPDGGGQPEQPQGDFRPEPGQPEARRRRGGRGRGE